MRNKILFILVLFAAISCRNNFSRESGLLALSDAKYRKSVADFFSGYKRDIVSQLQVPGINRIFTAKNLYMAPGDKVSLSVTCRDYEVTKNEFEKIISESPGVALKPFVLEYKMVSNSEGTSNNWETCVSMPNPDVPYAFQRDSYYSKEVFQGRFNRYNLALQVNDKLLHTLRDLVMQRNERMQPYCKVTQVAVQFGRCDKKIFSRERVFVPQENQLSGFWTASPGVVPFVRLAKSDMENIDEIGPEMLVTRLVESTLGLSDQALGGDVVPTNLVLDPVDKKRVKFHAGNLYTSSHPIPEMYVSLKNAQMAAEEMLKSFERRSQNVRIKEAAINPHEEYDRIQALILELKRSVPLSDEALLSEWQRKYDKWVSDSSGKYDAKLASQQKVFPKILFYHGAKDPHPASFASFISAAAMSLSRQTYVPAIPLKRQQWCQAGRDLRPDCFRLVPEGYDVIQGR